MPRGEEKKNRISVIDVILILLIVVLTATTLIKTYWLSPVLVDGGSMTDTIQNGDWLIMDKKKTPAYGDIIVIKIDQNTNYIKRAIAFEGDSIKTIDGELYRKKKGETEYVRLSEPYVGDKKTYGAEKTDIPETTVAKGEIYFLGDNRTGSTDSRKIGTRPLTDVIGVIPDWSLKYRHNYAWYYKFLSSINGLRHEKTHGETVNG